MLSVHDDQWENPPNLQLSGKALSLDYIEMYNSPVHPKSCKKGERGNSFQTASEGSSTQSAFWKSTPNHRLQEQELHPKIESHCCVQNANTRTDTHTLSYNATLVITCRLQATLSHPDAVKRNLSA